MCSFTQPASPRVIRIPSSVRRGSERCPIRSCRTRNAVATRKEVSPSLGRCSTESQHTPLPREKYQAIVLESLGPHPGQFQHSLASTSEGRREGFRRAELPREQRAGQCEQRLSVGPPPPTPRGLSATSLASGYTRGSSWLHSRPKNKSKGLQCGGFP